MNKMLLKTAVLCLILTCFLGGCGKEKGTPETTPTAAPVEPTNAISENITATPSVQKEKPVLKSIKSDTLVVNKVENLPDDFILGMDTSAVLSLEAGGVKYYDFEGKEEDVFKVLSDSGVNYIRVRVWNDPYDENGNGYGGGNCDINTAVEIGKRATKYGMKLLVDFHYSDFWADPSKQMVPKAWAGMEIEEKTEALYQYTKECLNKLKDAGVDVGMVQLGNETNGAMCGEKIWMRIYYLMDAGSRATREVFPEALIAVHFANPEKVTNYADYAKKLDYYNLDYDVFGSSYYPFWHGTLDNLAKVLSDIAEKYGKKVMVAENSYAYTATDTDFYGNTISDAGGIVKPYPFTIQGQANDVRNVVDTLVNKTKNAIGFFYWEGTWISAGGSSYEENAALWEKYGSGWAASYAKGYDPKDAGKYYGGCACDNQAFFDAKGQPLESLKVFGLMREGSEGVLVADAVEDTNLIIDLNGEINLPTQVNAVMTDDSKQLLDVTWKNVDYDKMKSSGAAKYDIVGEAGGMEAHCYVSMVEFNFVENYSFEDGEKGWKSVNNGEINELYVEDKSTDSLTGTKHYHFWSDNTHVVDFDLWQEVNNLPSGEYRFAISIMGGDVGDSEIYAFVKINDEIVETAPMVITSYGEWHEGVIENFSYTSGDKISVGIHCKCSGTGNGAWGKIDDALLNSVKK